MANPDPCHATRFKKGHVGPHWAPGQSGNPGGTNRLRREFDAALADALMGQDPAASAQLATIAWKAARKNEAWAVQLLFQRLAPQPLNVRVSRGEDDEHALDYSKLTDEELKTLEGIFARQGLIEGESGQKPQ